MTRVLVLRHGETEWNVTGRLQGRSDTELSAAGHRQARDATTTLTENFGSVYCSTLRRSIDTAGPLAARNSCEVRVDPRLDERSWGTWEGLLPSEVELEYPGWMNDGRRPPGFENDGMLWERFEPFLIELDSSDAASLVVTHGALMLAMARALNGADRPFGNLEGQWVELDQATVILGDRESFV